VITKKKKKKKEKNEGEVVSWLDLRYTNETNVGPMK
jgi:hypothetical protein